MEPQEKDRVRGCAVGSAVGDALGMPLEFKRANPPDQYVREMQNGRLPAGSFTDDTEMALALCDSLLQNRYVDASDLANRFLAWIKTGPPDVGIQTRRILNRIAAGLPWELASDKDLTVYPNASGNGSVMRCWPVALAWLDDSVQLRDVSRKQSRVTHPHADCLAACVLVNTMISSLVHGASLEESLEVGLDNAGPDEQFVEMIRSAPGRHPEELHNTGWVRHTIESAIWGLLTTGSFEDALIKVINLGEDADTAGAVVGALAGAAYGLNGIPTRWRNSLRGEWPVKSGRIRPEAYFINLADDLSQSFTGERISVF